MTTTMMMMMMMTHALNVPRPGQQCPFGRGGRGRGVEHEVRSRPGSVGVPSAKEQDGQCAGFIVWEAGRGGACGVRPHEGRRLARLVRGRPGVAGCLVRVGWATCWMPCEGAYTLNHNTNTRICSSNPE